MADALGDRDETAADPTDVLTADALQNPS